MLFDSTQVNSNMNTQRPTRQIQKPKRFRDSPSPDASSNALSIRVVKRQRASNPLLPIAAETAPSAATQPPNLHEIIEISIPFYIPPLKLIEFKGGPFSTPDTVLKTFQQLLCVACVDQIVRATNSYAGRVDTTKTPDTRPWTDTAAWEIWRYIGLLLYMGVHIEKRRELYWSDSHKLG